MRSNEFDLAMRHPSSGQRAFPTQKESNKADMVICVQVGDVDGFQTAEDLGSTFCSVETDKLAIGSFSAIQQDERIRTDAKSN